MQPKSKPRKSISRHISIVLAVLMLVMTAALSWLCYRSLKTACEELYNEKAQDLVRMLAEEVDGDRMSKYVETGVRDEYYELLREKLNRVKSAVTGIQYLYIFEPRDDHFVYIVEGVREDDDLYTINKLGDIYSFTEEDYLDLVPDIQAGKASTGLIKIRDQNKYIGEIICAWAPVFDSQGKLVAVVEADCVISHLNTVAWEFAGRIILAMALLSLVVLALLMLLMRRNVTQPIHRLTRMVDSYQDGRVQEETFRRDDEIKWLATSFTDLVDRVNEYTREVTRSAAEKERIGAQFNVARQIQMDILPTDYPAFPQRKEFDVYALMEPCRGIGGDFYDFFLVDDDHLALVLGDVSDSGVPAALFMVIVKTLIKNRTLQGFSPGEVLRDVSEQLLEENKSGMFYRIWLAVLDLSTGKGVAANAGHEHPMLHRPGRKFAMEVYQHSPPVGAMEGIRFRDHGFQLEPGDTLFIYSDGLRDAVNKKQELFGTDRLLAALNREPEATPSILIQTVTKAIHRFTGEVEQNDDMTMLAFKYYGQEPPKDSW